MKEYCVGSCAVRGCRADHYCVENYCGEGMVSGGGGQFWALLR